ncbi:MAG: hypothetical protein M1828_006595 [Chrysothrix sp. TS-e1954]|nr:MAG: hypothetical protein M1828_006595 [Chrysothrix sp. TS-e1954]
MMKLLSAWSLIIAAAVNLQPAHCTPAAASAPAHVNGSTHGTPHKDSHASINQTPYFCFNELWELTNKFFTSFMYPANVKQTKEINSTMFSKDVLGRVDVTRTFNGRELNTEYVYGLFANLATDPGAFTLLGLPLNYTIIHFAASQNVASTSAITYFNITALGVVTPIEVDFWATYNSRKQISQYDATFRWLDWQFDYLFDTGAKLFHLNSTAAVQKLATGLLAKSICKTAMTSCNGTNTQYKSASACEKFLTKDIRFGKSYELGMNTLLCRMVHQNMVPFRPGVHCSHIGPSGGGYCTDDRNYSGMVVQPYFVNAPFVPFGKPSSDW